MYQEYKYEPRGSEIIITKIIGNTLLLPYYKSFVASLGIKARGNVLDYCSGSGIITKLIAKKYKDGTITYSDVSKKWLNDAKNILKSYKNTKSLRIIDLKRSIGEELFDNVVVHFVIHDFPKEYQPLVIKQIIESTKVKGVIYIREPTNYSHGISVYRLINLLESYNNISYRYKKRKIPIIGEVIDIICKKSE